MVTIKLQGCPILIMALLLALAGSAHAQSPGATTANCGVEGYVLLNEEGTPATVIVQNTTDPIHSYPAASADEYGHYRITGLTPGTYVLNITPEDCHGGLLSEKFTVKSGETYRLNIPVSFKKGKLVGKATLDNAPLAGCLVRLYSPDHLDAPAYETTTDSNGDYVFDGIVSTESTVKPVLVSTAYKVVFTGDQFTPGWTLPGTFTVKKDKTTTANAKIAYQKGDITGTVRTESGTPIPYAKVTLHMANQTYLSPEIANTSTDINGNYTFRKVPATPSGNTTIWPRWWSPDFQYKVVSAISNDSTLTSQPLSVYPSMASSWDFRFPDAGYRTGSIRGYLVTNTGFGVPNETISLMGKKGKSNCLIMSTKTGPDGFYSFDHAYASDSAVRPGWWNGQYWLSYPTSRDELFTLSEGDAMVRNVTANAQPYLVTLTPEHHYVWTDGQCRINTRVFDRWGNPYTREAKICVEIANNDTYGGRDIGALNSNDKVSLTLSLIGGETNVTYGWASPRFTGWNVTLNGYPITKQANPIVTSCNLTIIPSGLPYPEEAPMAIVTPLPEDALELQDNESVQEQLPTPTEGAITATPVPGSESGSWIDQIWNTIMSLLNWQ